MPSGSEHSAVQNAKRRDRGYVGGVILLVLLFLSSLALIYTAANFDRRLKDVRAADTDNQGWIVAQLEVDHQGLMIATADALAAATYSGPEVPAEEWRALQREFDIFYSRVGVFISAMQRYELSEAFRGDLAELSGVRDRLAARIDSIGPNDIPGLLAFNDHLRSKQAFVRRVVTFGLQLFVDEAQEARERERQVWRFFLIETLVLLSLVLISGVLAFRLSRALYQRTRQVERAASTITKVYEVSLSAVLVTDINGRIQLCNKAAETMFGLPMDEINGGYVCRFAPGRLRPAMSATYAEIRDSHARREPLSVTRRSLARRTDGEIFPVALTLTTDRDADGQPIVIAFVRDISAQVQAERALHDALDEARRAAAAKSMFLATMSHEMRTPLHGLIAALDLINGDALAGEDAALFETARDCSQRALALVNDVLQFTRASAMREPEVAFSPARIAREVIHEMRAFARENNNEIKIDIHGPGLDQPVMGYPAAFSRSLYNLVGNAVKFTGSGLISVELSFSEPDPDGPIGLCVSVTDQGPGIAPADQERIFELFETSVEQTPHHTLATGLSGTGLGLPITRLAVERMGGQIRLDSELGRGSRFWFEISLRRADGSMATEAPVETRAAPKPTGVSWDVLVVDDNEVNLTLMREMVQRLGHRVTLARDGRQAVDLAQALRFDLVLMDINMPVMDGRTASMAIRQEGLCKEAVIIGVSALIDVEEPGAVQSCGMDRALVKPVRFDVLAATLAEIAAIRGSGQVSTDAVVAMEEAIPAPDTATGFDFASLAAMVGHDAAINLVQATLQDARTALSRVRAHDPDTGRAAHRAVGSAAMVGFEDLAATLREIEYAAMDGDRTALAELAEVLEELLITVSHEVEALPPQLKTGT